MVEGLYYILHITCKMYTDDKLRSSKIAITRCPDSGKWVFLAAFLKTGTLILIALN